MCAHANRAEQLMTSITERLANGKLLLLDGGVSTEIQKRGVALDGNVWSGLTTKNNPFEVRSVHEEYILAGSEVITANTYSTARHVLESIMLGHEAKILNFKSVMLAKQARDRVAKDEVWVAGSMSSMPPLTRNHRSVINKHAEASYREQAEVLVESGVDLIICEMMRDFENAEIVIKAAVSTGVPVWVGYSAIVDRTGRNVRGLSWLHASELDTRHDFAGMLQALIPLGGQVAGIMHTDLQDVNPALEVLGQHWSGIKMAYAETGNLHPPDWVFDNAVSPKAYLKAAQNWVQQHDVQIIGGCCGTGPEHIRMLKQHLL